MAADKKVPSGYWERRAWLRRLECSTAVKFVLLTLHEYAGDNEWAFPHQDTLAADVSLSERMVRRHLDWAISRGLLEVERTARGNRYRIDFTWPGYNRKRYDPAPQVELKTQPAERSSASGRKPHNVPAERSPMSVRGGHPRPMTPDAPDRCDRTPMSGAERTSSESPSESSHNIPANDVAETRTSQDGIRPEEFASLEQGQRRFEQFVAANRLRTADRLRFLTLWAYVDRRRTSPRPEDRIGNPGGFVTECVRRRQWSGSLCDEDRVRTWDRDARSKAAPQLDVAAIPVAETPMRSLLDDFLALRGLRSP